MGRRHCLDGKVTSRHATKQFIYSSLLLLPHCSVICIVVVILLGLCYSRRVPLYMLYSHKTTPTPVGGCLPGLWDLDRDTNSVIPPHLNGFSMYKKEEKLLFFSLPGMAKPVSDSPSTSRHFPILTNMSPEFTSTKLHSFPSMATTLAAHMPSQTLTV